MGIKAGDGVMVEGKDGRLIHRHVFLLRIPGSSKCVKFVPFYFFPKKPTKRQKIYISGRSRYVLIIYF